jgi:hypothetical protein
MTNFTAVQSASGTLVASTATTITFGNPTTSGVPIRYATVLVENTGTTGNIFARTDGQPATVGGDFCTEIGPGVAVEIANADPLWNQAATVIPKGAIVGGTPGTPAEVYPYGSSLWGGLANAGTTVSLISSGTPTYTVTGTE